MNKKNKIIRTCTVPRSFLELMKGQLGFLNQYYDVIAVSSSGKLLKETEEIEKVKTIPVDIQRRISPIKDLIALINLYLVFKKEKPQIVHSITPKAGLLTILAGKFAGVPIRIHTFTGLIFPTKTGIMQKLLISMDRLLCWASTNIYPEGQGVKNDLINYKITSKPLKVIANGNLNGIDMGYFNSNQIEKNQKEELKNLLGINKNDFVFIFVGRLVGDKGINELISAFEILKKDIKNIKLLLVGEEERELDPLNPKTIEVIKEDKDIISVGYQKDVRPYFSIANCLAFPSYREGFPNVVIQAGAMGLPCIVTDINGCNEIIEDKKNGLIIDAKNEKQLKKAMFECLRDKELYTRLKSNSCQMISERYEQSLVWNSLLNEYRVLLSNNEISKGLK